MNKYSLYLISLFFIGLPLVPAQAGLIRDAEVEATLRAEADPIFRAAGLNPGSVDIFIVNDDSLNAFVAGGANLFLHTGMILETTTPDMLMGVMAHETGHIAGGHLAKGGEKLKDAQLGTIMATVLGAAAAAATGQTEAAAAVITGANSGITRNFLSFTRANENAADQAALNYLDRLGVSASGMAEVFTLLKRQERQKFGKPDPYTRTHPLSAERVEFVQNHVGKSSIAPGTYPSNLRLKHERMIAKLYAFLKPPEQTLRKYVANDNAVAARMARAIAFYMQARIDEAAPIMHKLIAENPSDPYLYDLMGQIMFESARIDEALSAYRSASKLLPGNALILTDLAKTELARGTPQDVASALGHLDSALSRDKENAFTWHLLATAYGKQGNEPMVNLAMAEKALLQGDVVEALGRSQRAINTLPPGPSKQRANDLKARALQMKKEREDAESPF